MRGTKVEAAAAEAARSGHGKRRWLPSGLALVLVLLGLAGPSLAAPSPAERQAAKALAARALEAYGARRYREACGLYEQAYRKSPEPTYAYNAARLRDTLREWDAAATLYAAWIDAAPPDTERSTLRDKLSVSAADAAREGRHDLALQRLKLARRLELPPDPEITRRVALLLEASGRLGEALAHYRMALGEGHVKEASIGASVARLEEQLATAEVVLPTLQVGDVLLVDGVRRSVEPAGVLELNPGRHVLEIKRPDHETATIEVRLEPSGKLTVAFDPIPSQPAADADEPVAGGPGQDRGDPAGPPALTWAGLGVGGVALAAGGVFYLLGRDAYQDKNDCIQDYECVETNQGPELNDRAQSMRAAALVSAGVGAVLAAAAGVYWVAASGDDGDGGGGGVGLGTATGRRGGGPAVRGSRVYLLPLSLPAGGGLVLGGRF